jgi:uncharacterized protein (TIGR03663 family)
MMARALIIACWIGVVAAGVFLRFDDLAARPFHADEATGARITAKRMESGDANFDPTHFHGPLLADLAMPLCRTRGENGWREMSKLTLRLLPAIGGTLLVLLPLAGRRRFGDVPMLLASAFLATSPLLVYYSRMFIHEPLLALAGIAVVFSFTGTGARRGLPGFLIGLMFAAKETFAISIIAWSAAAALLAFENRESISRPECRRWLAPVSINLGTLVFTALFFYTDAFRHPRGAIDAVRTFFVYQTGDGHDKPFGWYFHLLLTPFKSGGMWWFGTPLVLLALWAFANTFRKDGISHRSRIFIRFLAYSAAGHFLIYSLIAYKNPWLACLPWAHACVLAGFALAGFEKRRKPVLVALILVAGFCIVTQFQQARAATGRLASDARNPFAYVPTRRDVEVLESWLGELREISPAGAIEPVAVVGRGYWPLPWYLRDFTRIGYWEKPPKHLTSCPLVFAMPETADAVAASLQNTHVALPRGLRDGVPLEVFVSKEIWETWMNSGNR